MAWIRIRITIYDYEYGQWTGDESFLEYSERKMKYLPCIGKSQSSRCLLAKVLRLNYDLAKGGYEHELNVKENV